MKLPSDAVAATAYRKDPDEFDVGNFHHIVLSETNFGAAKQVLKGLTDEEIPRTFIVSGDKTYRAGDVLAIMSGIKIAGEVPKADFDFFIEKAKVRAELFEIESIFKTGALGLNNLRNPLFRSALTMVLILLKDLLAQARKCNIDTVTKDERGDTDLLEVISIARDSACHLTTKNTKVGSSDVRFYVSRGEDNGAYIGGHQLGCNYADDAAIFFGSNRIYLKRDVIAAYSLLQARIDEIGGIEE